MSEKIYALLWRLYPANFRKTYGEEALQLFRDLARDEKGFISGLQLWLDLLRDLAISIPREYRSASAAVVVSQAPHLSDGTPSFHILEAETLSHPLVVLRRTRIAGSLRLPILYDWPRRKPLSLSCARSLTTAKVLRNDWEATTHGHPLVLPRAPLPRIDSSHHCDGTCSWHRTNTDRCRALLRWKHGP